MYEAGQEDEFVEFMRAGEFGKGEFRCVACGYGVVIYSALPRCPMCNERVWERDAWSPFSHMAEVFDTGPSPLLQH